MTERPRRILIVDDEEKILEMHERLARGLGYETETALDGVEALAKLALDVDLVLLDGQMPNMDGFEVARRIRATPGHEFLPIIMVTGYKGGADHRRALEAGINDFIAKPLDKDVLYLRTHWLLDLKSAHDDVREQKADLERLVEHRTTALRDALDEMTAAKRRIYQAHLDAIRRLTVATEFRDHETGGHIERIGLYAHVLAGAVDMSPGAVDTVRHAAPLHDVGKVGIPDQILLKPGSLSDDEWEIMRSHTTLGSEILAGSDSDVIRMGQKIARSHHERWDGSGYPDGLAGEEIPLEARICAVVDVFDAMTMDRPYRAAVPQDEVLEMMSESSGSHFDPHVLAAFLDHMPEITEIRTKYSTSA